MQFCKGYNKMALVRYRDRNESAASSHGSLMLREWTSVV